MEQSGRNQWQPVANGVATKTAQTRLRSHFEEPFQRREVVVDAVLDRAAGELRQHGGGARQFDVGVEFYDCLVVLGREAVAVEDWRRTGGGADRELTRRLVDDELPSGTGDVRLTSRLVNESQRASRAA